MKPGQFAIIFGGILLSVAMVITAGAYTQTEAFQQKVYYPALSVMIDGDHLAKDPVMLQDFRTEYIQHCLAGGLTRSFCNCTAQRITADKPIMAKLFESHANLSDQQVSQLVGPHEEACMHHLPPETTLLRSTQ